MSDVEQSRQQVVLSWLRSHGYGSGLQLPSLVEFEFSALGGFCLFTISNLRGATINCVVNQ